MENIENKDDGRGYIFDDEGNKRYMRGDSSIEERTCSRCGWEYANYTRYYDTGNEHICCHKCGYWYSKTIDEESSDFPKLINWVTKIEGGEGAVFYVKKSDPERCDYYRPASEEKKKELADNVLKYIRCKYSFKKDGKWLIYNLITKETTRYDYKDFCSYSEQIVVNTKPDESAGDIT